MPSLDLAACVVLAGCLAVVLCWLAVVKQAPTAFIVLFTVVVGGLLFLLQLLGRRCEHIRPDRNCRQALCRSTEGKHSGTHVDSLDGLRAVAVSWVILYHALCVPTFFFVGPTNYNQFIGQWYMQFAFSGAMGVDLFFVLSGFLIVSLLVPEGRKAAAVGANVATQAADDAIASTESRAALGTCNAGVRYGAFLLKRFLRLAPAYLVLLAYNVSPLQPDETQRETCRAWWWLNVPLFLNNYFDLWVAPHVKDPLYRAWLGCDLHTWTVAVEWQFYLASVPLVHTLLLLERWMARRERCIERARARALRLQLVLLAVLIGCTVLLRWWLRRQVRSPTLLSPRDAAGSPAHPSPFPFPTLMIFSSRVPAALTAHTYHCLLCAPPCQCSVRRRVWPVRECHDVHARWAIPRGDGSRSSHAQPATVIRAIRAIALATRAFGSPDGVHAASAATVSHQGLAPRRRSHL